MAGRPTLVTQDRVERICELLRAGNTLAVAGQCAGLAPGTINEWIYRGHTRRSTKYVEFVEAIEKARAEAEQAHVQVIEDAMRGRGAFLKPSWTAAAWWLERRNPGSWGRRSVSEVSPEKATEVLSAAEEADQIASSTIVSSFDAAFKVLYESGAMPWPVPGEK